MKREKNYISVKIVSALVVVIFSLAACFTGTWAWFASNIQVSSSGMSVTIHSEDLELTYSIYKYDITADSPVHLSEEDVTDFSLNQYDVVFKERNKYNVLFLELQLTGDSLGASGTVAISLDRDLSMPAMDEDNHLYKSFTSVTKYATGANSFKTGGIYSPSNTVENTWDNLNAAFLDRDNVGELNTKSFTSGSTGNYTKANSLSLNITYSSSDFVGNVLYAFLYINYDATLAENYSLEHDVSIGGESNFELDDDLASISIKNVQ